jgi:exodeoxyribonuclease III
MKVMVWNVLLGGEDRLDDIAAVVRREQPDALALVEATAKGTAALAAELAWDTVLSESNHRFPRSYGLCVAWLRPGRISSAAEHRLPELAKTLLGIELGGAWLYATHLASRHEQDDHPRKRELRAILDVLDDGRHLLCGDFNALAAGDPIAVPPEGVEPRGDALQGAPREVLTPLTGREYVDCYRALHPDESGYTYASEHPWLRLDYVFASRELAPALRAAGVVADPIATRASDHLPVWAEFA